MILSSSGDHGDRNITNVVESIGLVDEVVVEELGVDMVWLRLVIDDISSLEGEGDREEAHEDRGLGLSTGHGEGCFKNFLRVALAVGILG